MIKKFLGSVVFIFIFSVTFFILLKLFGGQKQTQKELSTTHEKNEILRPGMESTKMAEAFGATPFLKVRSRKYKNDVVLYDVIYEHDADGLRKTQLSRKESYDEHLIIAGCSFVYGEGLNVNDSLPFLLEQELVNINAYNLGSRGGSLSTVLFYMKREDIREVIKEKKGKFIYQFMFNHLNRWVGKNDFLSWAWDSYPYFENNNGLVEYKGPIKDQAFFKLYKNAQSFGLPHLFTENKNHEYKDHEIKNFVEGLVFLKETYLNDFPEGEFYLLIHLSENYGIHNRVVKHAKNLGLSVLDASSFFWSKTENQNLYLESYSIFDGHPNREANIFMRDFILDHLYRARPSRGPILSF